LRAAVFEAPKRSQFDKLLRSVPWILGYGVQRSLRLREPHRPEHLIIALADHFEPAIVPGPGARQSADLAEQERRLKAWCAEYPAAIGDWRDDDGWPFRHTYFYPAEQYDEGIVGRLAEHCHTGWGEVEVHLHHGVESPDTAGNTRFMLRQFVERLGGHGCLSRWDGDGALRYAFVHGNWALANSAGGRFCGVDEELAILAETGCYADLTLPSAPSSAQVSKINALYECALPLERRSAHRRGKDLTVGAPPATFPLIIQGPLGLNFARRIRGWPVPCIENGALTTRYAPSLSRLDLWRQARITVRGRPDWVFVKLHCHGMDPRDRGAMVGEPIRVFLKEVTRSSRERPYAIHFVTAREMVNIALAACDGREGDPGRYRDYRLRLVTPPCRP
jgi:hypothetical protein